MSRDPRAKIRLQVPGTRVTDASRAWSRDPKKINCCLTGQIIPYGPQQWRMPSSPHGMEHDPELVKRSGTSGGFVAVTYTKRHSHVRRVRGPIILSNFWGAVQPWMSCHQDGGRCGAGGASGKALRLQGLRRCRDESAPMLRNSRFWPGHTACPTRSDSPRMPLRGRRLCRPDILPPPASGPQGFPCASLRRIRTTNTKCRR